MRIEKANEVDIESIVEMSKRAFLTDINVGGKRGDYPPDYDSLVWHKQMADEGHLYKAISDNKMVGAAIIFIDDNLQHLYVGRIFVDSVFHKKGYGIKLMKSIEAYFPHIQQINLDTPSWNIRTNSFYQKIGYTVVKEEDGFVFYQKKRT
ncbi:MAG: GNAT family N-acetyltransferase [Firmicutes bacterium]|nr:GNAT family N-acetyltransferase [Candidatus Colivicinus equi]